MNSEITSRVEYVLSQYRDGLISTNETFAALISLLSDLDWSRIDPLVRNLFIGALDMSRDVEKMEGFANKNFSQYKGFIPG